MSFCGASGFWLLPSLARNAPSLSSYLKPLTAQTRQRLPKPCHLLRLDPASTFLLLEIDSCLLRRFVAGCAKRMTSMGEGSAFKLSGSSVLKILRGDITKWSIDGSSDAIVNPANERMLGGGGADGAIHRAAGPQLREACYNVPEVRPGVRCPTGEARITPGFDLPASHVIYTVGPIYDHDSNPKASLKNAYCNSLKVAKESNIKYVAFPAISCGVYGYPYDEAASVAISTIREFANGIEEVYFVMFSDDIYDVWKRKAGALLEEA